LDLWNDATLVTDAILHVRRRGQIGFAGTVHDQLTLSRQPLQRRSVGAGDKPGGFV
jgi:hypothetical protein